MTGDHSKQEPLFAIDGPDNEGCVWIRSTAGRGGWRQNLGPKDDVAKILYRWLGTVDPHHREQFWAPLLNR